MPHRHSSSLKGILLSLLYGAAQGVDAWARVLVSISLVFCVGDFAVMTSILRMVSMIVALQHSDDAVAQFTMSLLRWCDLLHPRSFHPDVASIVRGIE
ncbi:hypothetical protein ACN38_g2888 [Penicillium nordicum]|uniref:Uncharacterized protein n=1 Tax=Penicillium nordicum TaxID=229535 RepID=A0A0M9WIL1_9EURO|nr:hypothetical protein ACN38_g2888 [Penicillium nordicum]